MFNLMSSTAATQLILVWMKLETTRRFGKYRTLRERKTGKALSF